MLFNGFMLSSGDFHTANVVRWYKKSVQKAITDLLKKTKTF